MASSPSSTAASPVAKLNDIDEALESWSVTEIVPTIVVDSPIENSVVDPKEGASLTFVIATEKSAWLDKDPSDATTVKSMVLSLFKSVGDSKSGAVTNETWPVEALIASNPSSFEPDESSREYVTEEPRSSSTAEIVVRTNEFSATLVIDEVEIDGASGASVTLT
tara:strand:+ start:295 stop:789 length:495 start_codon:yes stop_codon:yes gene_type:complete